MIYSVGVALLTFFFFTLLIVAGTLLYKRRINLKYSLKNMFPFEFTYKSTPKENLYTYIFIALFIMSGAGFFATFDLTYKNGFLVFCAIGGILASLAIIALFIVPLTHLRLHLIFAVSFFVLNFANSASLLVAAWKSNQEYMQPIKIVVIVLAIISVLVEFGTILNPRLSLDFRAEETTNEKGEKEYVRPKWVVFAFTEWLHIFLYLLSIISITIFTFAII